MLWPAAPAPYIMYKYGSERASHTKTFFLVLTHNSKQNRPHRTMEAHVAVKSRPNPTQRNVSNKFIKFSVLALILLALGHQLQSLLSSNKRIEDIQNLREIGKGPPLGKIDPKDFYLLYSKTAKTSGTVATNIIAYAYEQAGMRIYTHSKRISCTALAGTYAAATHYHPTSAQLQELNRCLGKPILFVVSVRDGADWYKSLKAAAHTIELSESSKPSCIKERNVSPNLRSYSIFFPTDTETGLLDYDPWYVLNHTSIVEDTCEMLEVLGLKCDRRVAVGQVSRKHIPFCPGVKLTVDHEVAKQINNLNTQICRRAMHHPLDKLPISERQHTCRKTALGRKWV